MKQKIVIGLALVGGLWIVASIQGLKDDVNGSYGVRAKLDRVENELRDAKIEAIDSEVSARVQLETYCRH